MARQTKHVSPEGTRVTVDQDVADNPHSPVEGPLGTVEHGSASTTFHVPGTNLTMPGKNSRHGR